MEMDVQDRMRFEATLARHEQRMDSFEHRIGCVESMQKNLADLVTSVAVLAEQYKTIANDTGQINTRLMQLEGRPASRYESFVKAILSALAGGGVALALKNFMGG